MPSDRTRPYIPRSTKRSSTTNPSNSNNSVTSNNPALTTASLNGMNRTQSLPGRRATPPVASVIIPPAAPPTPSTIDDDEDEQQRLIHDQRRTPHKHFSPSPSQSLYSSPDDHGPPPMTTPLTRQPTRLTGPIQVQTNLQIFRVHKIDSSSEEFTIDCGITFIWKDPFLAQEAGGKYFASHPAVVRHKADTGRSDYELWPDNFIVGQNVFDPAWKIMNCSDLEVIKNFTTIWNSEEGLVHNYLHIRATIYQTLDLHSFPFDHQEMTIRIQSEHSTEVVQFVAMSDRSPRLYDNNIASEWNINCDSMKLHFVMDNKPAASGVTYAAMTCTFSATRRAEWYIHNVFTISYTIVFSSFSIFFVPSANTAERLSILFTTWLMLISLKFIISDRLPKISYLTTLDKYLHSSYLVMIALIINVCAVQVTTARSATVATAGGAAEAEGLVTEPYHEWGLGWFLFLGWTAVNLHVLRPILRSYFA